MIARMERRNARRRHAFTLMEMLVVVAIIVALAGIGGFYFIRQLGESQRDLAMTQAKNLTTACEAYEAKFGVRPPSLEALLAKDEATGAGPYLKTPDALKDPWGQQFQYAAEGSRNNMSQPDIFTTTKDGAWEIGNFGIRKK